MQSELVLNEDQSVYHLRLRDEHIADHVILVGDPARVPMVSAHFDTVEHRISNREFHTHTGRFRGTRITALSTGIGPDNIDIAVNELDAAVNIDPLTRRPRPVLRRLNLIRLGTCGALQPGLDVECTAITSIAIGLDGVRHFYRIDESEEESRLCDAFRDFMKFPGHFNRPYASAADPLLLQQFQHLGPAGITITANGFFGPQGRQLRLPLASDTINDSLGRFRHEGLQVLNYEMESAVLYALGKALGHRCLCMCVVVANRIAGKFSKDYHPAVERLIGDTLEMFAESKNTRTAGMDPV